MYLYFDKKGTLKEIINDEALRQGNYGINKLYVYIEDRDYSSIDVSYLLQSNLVVGPNNYDDFSEEYIPYDAKRDLRFFKYNKKYNFLVIPLEEDFNHNSPLDEAGVVHCEMQAIIAGNNILQLGDVNFVVEENAVLNQKQVASEQYLSLADYLFLRSLINKEKPSKQVTGVFNTSNFTQPSGEDYYKIDDISLNGDLGDLMIITWGNSFALCPIPSLMNKKGEQLVDGSWETDHIEDGRYPVGEFSLLGEWTLDQLYPLASCYIYLYGNSTYTAHLTNGQIEILEVYEQNGQKYTRVSLTFDLGDYAEHLCPGWEGTFDMEDEEVWELIQYREGFIAASMISSNGITKIVRMKYVISDKDKKLSITTDSSFIPPVNYTGYVINYKIVY